MSETQAATPAAKKSETVYTPVTMEDGRVVQFAGSRKADKTVEIDVAAGVFTLRIDFANGKTVSLSSADLNVETLLTAGGHGISQKVGDSYASEKEVDDMHLAAEEMASRLRAGDWTKAREAGDSMNGASIVIKAIVEATGKSVEFVKAYLQKKLDDAKAKGEKLSRQELYNGFRKPGTATATIIKRLEEEKASKSSKVDAASELEAITAG